MKFKNKMIIDKMIDHLYKEDDKHDRPQSTNELDYVRDSINEWYLGDYKEYHLIDWSKVKTIFLSHYHFLDGNGYEMEAISLRNFINSHDISNIID